MLVLLNCRGSAGDVRACAVGSQLCLLSGFCKQGGIQAEGGAISMLPRLPHRLGQITYWLLRLPSGRQVCYFSRPFHCHSKSPSYAKLQRRWENATPPWARKEITWELPVQIVSGPYFEKHSRDRLCILWEIWHKHFPELASRYVLSGGGVQLRSHPNIYLPHSSAVETASPKHSQG